MNIISAIIWIISFSILHESGHIISLLYEDNIRGLKFHNQLIIEVITKDKPIKNKKIVYFSGFIVNILTYNIMNIIEYINPILYIICCLFSSSIDIVSYILDVYNIGELKIKNSFPFIELIKNIT